MAHAYLPSRCQKRVAVCFVPPPRALLNLYILRPFFSFPPSLPLQLRSVSLALPLPTPSLRLPSVRSPRTIPHRRKILGPGMRWLGTTASASVVLALPSANYWWDEMNGSIVWQDRIFHTLSVLYGFVSAVALIQLSRIECRVPEFGWTTQKVFHLLHFLVNGLRSLVFVFRQDVAKITPDIIQHILLEFPGLLFFTTYALLVLFWAEIYYQARSVSTDELRPTFYAINTVVYVIQISLWLVLWWKPMDSMIIVSKIFFAGVSLLIALGFLLYGGRLFLMLKRFPIDSKGRQKKLQEVGYVTAICFFCFLLRCVMMCINAFDKAANLDVLEHPILIFIYYVLVEILPSALVLFILRKLPPKRGINQYGIH